MAYQPPQVERDKLFDHAYDGIQEYDNPLPSWWVWLFALSAVFALPYIVYMHYGKGLSVEERWQAEQEAYAASLLERYGELAPDRETLLSYMDDELAMTGISGLFRGRCAQCHVADGSGNVGPNLTDDRWLNVKHVTDIPTIIRSGLVAKGMPAWGDRMTETQIVLLSSYVAKLSARPVDGKQAEGDPLPAWETIPAPVAEVEASSHPMDARRIDSMLEPEERVLSTLNRDGSRRWLKPRPSSGKWLRRRQVVGYALIALFAGLPYLRIGGKPAVLLDLARREFTILGQTLYATDTLLLALAMLSIFVTIFLLTALFGRVWCGWGCPQTVYLELVYRPIERLFEGRHYKTAGRTPLSVARQVGKYATFLLISFFLSHIFLAYFVGTEELWAWMHHSPFAHPSAFGLVVGVTALMMFDFAYMREQVCTLICPYGRLQSVLIDKSSMIVSYDKRRGEPRGKRRKGDEQEHGDCIDCFKCVTTCPTGIDIRDGLQMECVHCTQCIDACDDVMVRLDRPKGLIRYGSQNGMAGEPGKRFRPRVVIYPLILLTTLSLFGLAIEGQDPFDVTLLRSRNMTYQLADDGNVTNVVQLKIQNRADIEHGYTIEIVGESTFTSSDLPLSLPPRGTGEATLRILTPRARFDGGRAEVLIRVTQDSGEIIEMKRQVLGPLFGSQANEE